jgi:catechol 2,3-dioxygenase-like lactoylglutathione lyase family enzyme
MDVSNLRVTAINHVVLNVTDMERSIKFYMEILGFENRNESGEFNRARNFLLCGMQGLDLFEVPREVTSGQEMNHMAFNVAANDLDEVEKALLEVGVEASARTHRNSVFIADPDGHRIEILPRNAHERERERAQ